MKNIFFYNFPLNFTWKNNRGGGAEVGVRLFFFLAWSLYFFHVLVTIIQAPSFKFHKLCKPVLIFANLCITAFAAFTFLSSGSFRVFPISCWNAFKTGFPAWWRQRKVCWSSLWFDWRNTRLIYWSTSWSWADPAWTKTCDSLQTDAGNARKTWTVSTLLFCYIVCIFAFLWIKYFTTLMTFLDFITFELISLLYIKVYSVCCIEIICTVAILVSAFRESM